MTLSPTFGAYIRPEHEPINPSTSERSSLLRQRPTAVLEQCISDANFGQVACAADSRRVLIGPRRVPKTPPPAANDDPTQAPSKTIRQFRLPAMKSLSTHGSTFGNGLRGKRAPCRVTTATARSVRARESFQASRRRCWFRVRRNLRTNVSYLMRPICSGST